LISIHIQITEVPDNIMVTGANIFLNHIKIDLELRVVN
jgi:hypothetical protein